MNCQLLTMKTFLLFLLIIPLYSFAYSPNKNDSLLKVLKTEIGRSGEYLKKKELRIQEFKTREHELAKDNYPQQFIVANLLYDEYKSYQFDSAYVYVNKMLKLSRLMNDKPKEY